MLRDGSSRAQEAETALWPVSLRPLRSRWCRVRVETDEGAYVGSLRLDGGTASLRDTLDGRRVYLALWDAVHEASQERHGFLVIHKSAIRQVSIIGRASAPAGTPAEA
jgi:hypothetical protein